jgi:hypothetical protein
MPNPFDIPPAVEYERLILERIKVAARQVLGPQVAHDLKVQTWMEHMTDQMVLELRTHVYAHKVDHQEVRVPFQRSETVTVPGSRRLLWTYPLVALLGVLLGFAYESLPAFILSGAAALAFVIVHASNPGPYNLTVEAKGEVVVERDQWNAFPDNTTVYPDSLGGPVQIAQIQTPAVYYERP